MSLHAPSEQKRVDSKGSCHEVLEQVFDNFPKYHMKFSRFLQSCTNFDLKISSKKTKSLIISKEPLKCTLQVYNTTIEQVTSFNYLGVQTTSGGPRWRSWLRHCATSQKVAGSIPDGVIGIFH